jgi:hypothetical protein
MEKPRGLSLPEFCANRNAADIPQFSDGSPERTVYGRFSVFGGTDGPDTEVEIPIGGLHQHHFARLSDRRTNHVT